MKNTVFEEFCLEKLPKNCNLKKTKLFELVFLDLSGIVRRKELRFSALLLGHQDASFEPSKTSFGQFLNCSPKGGTLLIFFFWGGV